MTTHGLCCSHFTACTHYSTLQHPPFVVCLRHFSVLRSKNSRTYRSPTAPHGGITVVVRVFGSQHHIVSNSYKLVRAPRRLSSPCPSHRSRTAHCSRHSAPSAHKFWTAPHGMSAHRRGHCALCLPHTPRFESGRLHATLHLGVSAVVFYQTPLPAHSSTTYS